MPHMARPKPAGEMTVLPRIIEVEAGIVLGIRVAHPFAIGVHMGSFGMPLLVGKRVVVGRWFCVRLSRRRPARRNISVTNVLSAGASLLTRMLLSSSALAKRRQSHN